MKNNTAFGVIFTFPEGNSITVFKKIEGENTFLTIQASLLLLFKDLFECSSRHSCKASGKPSD